MPVIKLFIGSSSAAKSQAKKFVETLSNSTIRFIPWWDSITPGQFLLDELDSIYKKVDGAVLIFSPESETTIRKDKKKIPNLNVLFEFGYFLGALERKKVVLVKYGQFYLPSDFGGYQWIHGSKGFRRGGVQALSVRTKREFGRWLAKL
ncbi:MAG: TIR domain-containing protein [Pseudomonadota bacterium]